MLWEACMQAGINMESFHGVAGMTKMMTNAVHGFLSLLHSLILAHSLKRLKCHYYV